MLTVFDISAQCYSGFINFCDICFFSDDTKSLLTGYMIILKKCFNTSCRTFNFVCYGYFLKKVRVITRKAISAFITPLKMVKTILAIRLPRKVLITSCSTSYAFRFSVIRLMKSRFASNTIILTFLRLNISRNT